MLTLERVKELKSKVDIYTPDLLDRIIREIIFVGFDEIIDKEPIRLFGDQHDDFFKYQKYNPLEWIIYKLTTSDYILGIYRQERFQGGVYTFFLFKNFLPVYQSKVVEINYPGSIKRKQFCTELENFITEIYPNL